MKKQYIQTYRQIAEIACASKIIDTMPENEEALLVLVDKMFEHLCVIPKKVSDSSETTVAK